MATHGIALGDEESLLNTGLGYLSSLFFGLGHLINVGQDASLSATAVQVTEVTSTHRHPPPARAFEHPSAAYRVVKLQARTWLGLGVSGRPVGLVPAMTAFVIRLAQGLFIHLDYWVGHDRVPCWQNGRSLHPDGADGHRHKQTATFH